MWEPATPNHAIERVVIMYVFNEPLPSRIFLRALGYIGAKAREQGFGELFALPAFTLAVGAQDPGIAGAQVGSPAQGQILRRTKDGVMEQELVCQPAAFTLTSTVYGRWNDFIGLVDECLSQALELSLGAVSLREARLEYFDRFQRKADGPGQGDPLLKPASQLAPAFMSERNDSWHLHLGFFSDRLSPLRALANANIDVIANPPGRHSLLPVGIEAQARIYTAVTAYPEADSLEKWDDVTRIADQQHTFVKAILGELIHPDLAGSISLDAASF